MDNLQWVYLNEIEKVNYSDLIPERLEMLENGILPFEDLIFGKSNDPIVLDSQTKPYTIIDGRHRVYLARKKGYSRVKVKFI